MGVVGGGVGGGVGVVCGGVLSGIMDFTLSAVNFLLSFFATTAS